MSKTDYGAEVYNKVQRLKQEAVALQTKLAQLELQLELAEEELEEMRGECNHCGDCSACIG
jgi:chromosome segregation ATPase